MAEPAILAALKGWQPALPLAVAYSGGADSTALLWACQQRYPGQVHAIHINHGLQAAASIFEAHCRAQCAAWDVPLQVVAVNAHPQPGQSPEDAARIARYQALAGAALAAVEGGQGGIQTIALAQHADDHAQAYRMVAGNAGRFLPGNNIQRPAGARAQRKQNAQRVK